MNTRRRQTERTNCRRKRVSHGLAALEVVLATGISIPVMILLLYAGIRLCRVFFSVLGTMTGSSFM